MTPFRTMYGREAATIHEYTLGSNHTASIDESLREHQRLTTILKIALEHTRQRMSKQANKKRLDKQFQVADFVYLRLRNYRQNSVAARDNQKLAKRFFGPYRVLEKIGPVAYRLELPIASRVHPVFHVSLLKESHSQTASSEFPSEWLNDAPSYEPQPESILRRRQSGDKQEILVKWMNHEQEEATWEDLNEISTRFLDFIRHEDAFVLQREGIDTTQSQAAHQQPANLPSRPKRIHKKPNRLLD
uniref:Reverse transcriptase n=1 Tax=Tanacetum cinerariifolium TaxID=118510 RepID=A0A6L2J5I3_TANCI|nr:reverse transcriptase [Tanacetum cinerariifolium]